MNGWIALCGMLVFAAMVLLSPAADAVTWVEGEDFALATNTGMANVSEKPLASGGKVLYGPATDKEGNVVEYRFTLDEPVADAKLIFRYARLHWRETMVPAPIKLELVGTGDPLTLDVEFPDTGGWGSAPSHWQLMTADVGGPLAAGEWMLRLTSLADSNSVNLDGFFIAEPDFAVTAAELSSLLRLKIDSGGYVGLRLNSGAIRQDRTKTLGVANRLFAPGSSAIAASIIDEAGKRMPLPAVPAENRVSADVAIHVFALSDLADGTYQLEVDSTLPEAQLELSLTLLGEFLSTLDERMARIEEFAASLPATHPGAAEVCGADFEHAVEFLKAARETMSQSVVQPSTSAWREHIAEQERESDPAPLALSMKATVEQYEETMARIQAGRSPYYGRTGQFRRAFESDASGDLVVYRSLIPGDYNRSDSVPFVLMLHGGGGDENYFPDMDGGTILRILDERGYLAVCPRYGRHYDVSDDDLLQLIDLTLQQYPKIDPDRIYVTGISMGGGTTYRLAVNNPNLFAAACCVSAGSRGEGAESLATTPMLSLHGEGDGVLPVARARALEAKMKELGYQHKLITFAGHGHEYHAEQYLNLTLDFFDKTGAKKR